ncbi:MAG: hypothetical protein ACI4R9_03060 [Kiritimatiellia bacterium]
MPASSLPLDDVLPHRKPMVLIDEIVSCDPAAGTLTAAVTVRREWCENWAAIEFMAQTAAALVGAADRAEGCTGPARPGFLLGTRRLDLDVARFDVGARYLITAVCVFSDATAASFDCAITRDGRTVAKALLNAYRPPDVREFLSERR